MYSPRYILLSSARDDQEATRSFNEFHTKSELARHVIDYFEDWLRTKDQVNLEVIGDLEYTSTDLFNFVDEFFGELVCLVNEQGPEELWVPLTCDWVKETIYFYLREITLNLTGLKPAPNPPNLNDSRTQYEQQSFFADMDMSD